MVQERPDKNVWRRQGNDIRNKSIAWGIVGPDSICGRCVAVPFHASGQISYVLLTAPAKGRGWMPTRVSRRLHLLFRAKEHRPRRQSTTTITTLWYRALRQPRSLHAEGARSWLKRRNWRCDDLGRCATFKAKTMRLPRNLCIAIRIQSDQVSQNLVDE